MSTKTIPPTDGQRIGACAYLLHMLLQRAELQQPGLLAQMLEGVAADRAGMPAGTPARETVDGVFAEAQRMLSLAQAQLGSAGAS